MYLLFLELLLIIICFPFLVITLFNRKYPTIDKAVTFIALINTVLNILYVIGWVKVNFSTKLVENTEQNIADQFILNIIIIIFGLMNCYFLKYFYDYIYNKDDHFKKIQLIAFFQFIFLIGYAFYIFYYRI